MTTETRTYADRVRIQQAYRDFLRSLNINLFITFNFGNRVNNEVAFKSITKFCNVVERKTHGTRWQHKKREDRITLLAFGENMYSNPHWHGAGTVPEKTLFVMKTDGIEIWSKIQKRGQLHVERPESVERVINYTTKRLWEYGADSRVGIYIPR